MPPSRPFCLVDHYEQVLPCGKKVIHLPWTLLTRIDAPSKINDMNRTMLTFKVDDEHPPLELTTSQVSVFPLIVAITEDFGLYMRFDTFDVDFSQQHSAGLVLVTDRSKKSLTIPVKIIEGVAGHADELARHAS